jgi:hypothetical protein
MARPYPEYRPYKGTLHEVQSFFRWLETHPELQCASSTVERYGRALDGQVNHFFHAVAVFSLYYPECKAPAAAALSTDGSSEPPAWPAEVLAGWLDFMAHYGQNHDVGFVFSVLTNTLPRDLGGSNDASDGSRDLLQRLLPLVCAYLLRRP